MRETSRIDGAREICKGALAATTGQARSANMVDVRMDAPVAPVVVVQVVPGGGVTQAVTIGGHLVCDTGHRVSVGGHLVCTGGHDVSTGGQRVATGPVAEQAVSCAGHCVVTGGQTVSLAGHLLNSGGH